MHWTHMLLVELQWFWLPFIAQSESLTHSTQEWAALSQIGR
jgi:hypothetical protein